MAYVAKRRNGRFEIRESLQTPRGPRARTLAGFKILTDALLARAEQRATRPFDAAAVIDSAKRAGARVDIGLPTDPALTAAAVASPGQPVQRGGALSDAGGFVAASRRMALSLQSATQRTRTEPGEALIELLGFADAVTAGQPPRPRERLSFPVLAGLAGHAGAATGAS
jgi:hypothetical protein